MTKPTISAIAVTVMSQVPGFMLSIWQSTAKATIAARGRLPFRPFALPLKLTATGPLLPGAQTVAFDMKRRSE